MVTVRIFYKECWRKNNNIQYTWTVVRIIIILTLLYCRLRLAARRLIVPTTTTYSGGGCTRRRRRRPTRAIGRRTSAAYRRGAHGVPPGCGRAPPISPSYNCPSSGRVSARARVSSPRLSANRLTVVPHEKYIYP